MLTLLQALLSLGRLLSDAGNTELSSRCWDATNKILLRKVTLLSIWVNNRLKSLPITATCRTASAKRYSRSKTFVTCWKRELIPFCYWWVGGKYQKNGQGHGIWWRQSWEFMSVSPCMCVLLCPPSFVLLVPFFSFFFSFLLFCSGITVVVIVVRGLLDYFHNGLLKT